jgi:hypothetical protein
MLYPSMTGPVSSATAAREVPSRSTSTRRPFFRSRRSARSDRSAAAAGEDGAVAEGEWHAQAQVRAHAQMQMQEEAEYEYVRDPAPAYAPHDSYTLRRTPTVVVSVSRLRGATAGV